MSNSLMTAMSSVDAIRTEPGINLWVFNKTSSFARDNRLKDSVVLLSIRVGNGEKDIIINIPPSWAPINIGYYANKKQIIESADFLRAVNRGLIQPITSKAAQDFIKSNPEAETEMERAVNSVNARQPVELDRTDFASGNIDEIEADPKVIQSVFRLTEGQINANEFNAIIRNIELQERDYVYIMKNVVDSTVLGYVNKMRPAVAT
jgi:hypothetical protein